MVADRSHIRWNTFRGHLTGSFGGDSIFFHGGKISFYSDQTIDNIIAAHQ